MLRGVAGARVQEGGLRSSTATLWLGMVPLLDVAPETLSGVPLDSSKEHTQ